MGHDAIVVGSGVAGMTAGIVLAREGLRTLVLEQAPQPGGLMRSYVRDGYRFSTGVHTVGALGEGQVLWRYLKYLGVLERLSPVALDAEAPVELVFPDRSFLVPSAAGAFRERLLGEFPRERRAIDAFFAEQRRAVGLFPLYGFRPDVERLPAELRDVSVKAYLDGLTACEPLKGILSAIHPFYGTDPAECPLYVHFLVFDSLLTGCWRFDEGRAPLAGAFVAALRAVGGQVRCGARVAAIESSEGTVRGVRLAGGERVEAGTVVFTGHPKQLAALCAGGGLRHAYLERVAAQPESVGMFGAAIAWEGAECCLRTRDVLVYMDTAASRGCPACMALGVEPVPALVCSAGRGPEAGRHAAIGLAPVPPEEWQAWKATGGGARPADYEAAKQRLAERILGVFRRLWPHAAGGMRIVDSFSPLTVRDHTLSPLGSAYGLRKSTRPGFNGSISTATRVHGLVLAGQSIVLPGVVGTVIGSVDACASIVGRRRLIERIARETE